VYETLSPNAGCGLQRGGGVHGRPRRALLDHLALRESGFVFHHPGALFLPNQEYTFDLGAGITSVNGNVNSLDHLWN